LTVKIYQGVRTPQGCVVTVTDGEKSYALPLRHDLHNHSPSGFEWGYAGSGPSQLALAMVADVTGDDKHALKCYQEFKDYIIAKIKTDTWKYNSIELREFC
jgi:hypothetical protein